MLMDYATVGDSLPRTDASGLNCSLRPKAARDMLDLFVRGNRS